MAQFDLLFSNSNLSPELVSKFFVVYLLVIIWSLFWKGMALWRASRLGQKGWFWALMLLNTVGILEIIYIYVVSKEKKLNTTTSPNMLKKEK